MPRIRERKPDPRQAEPKAERPIPAMALSIAEFVKAHNLSIDSYFRMQRAGLGPKTMKIGARTLISIEAAAAWRRERERATNEATPKRQAGTETIARP